MELAETLPARVGEGQGAIAQDHTGKEWKMCWSKILRRCIRITLPVLGIMTLLLTSVPQTAHAGLFRMLLGGNGGGSQQRDWTHVTSRKLVPFSRNYETGTIVVSFADRRLYLVQKPGQAYSYLIGTPVLEEKWQGVLNVSDKRLDPRWVPTPDMRRKDPSLPLAVAGGAWSIFFRNLTTVDFVL